MDILDEIYAQRNNYARVNHGEYPNAIIMPVKMYYEIQKSMPMHFGTISRTMEIWGMKIYRSYDADDFKVCKINPDFPS